MTNITLNLNTPPKPDPAKTVVQHIDRILTPYKLRSITGGAVRVIIKVPTAFGAGHTYLFLGTTMQWCGGDADGIRHINETYEFVGPLLPSESVTIAC